VGVLVYLSGIQRHPKPEPLSGRAYVVVFGEPLREADRQLGDQPDLRDIRRD
jgi:hypothetical protein